MGATGKGTRMPDTDRILIAGAGIGGLTAALALLREGFDVLVLEQAAALREIGAGFQLSANGTRVLFALGLEDAVRSVAWEPKGKEIRLWNTGERWPVFDLGAHSVERYGFPYLMLHRADLQAILAAAVRRLKPDAIAFDRRVLGFTQSDAGVRLSCETAAPIAGAALIGADGVHSCMRQTLFGPDRPVFTGCVAWRGLVPTERLPAHLVRPFGSNWVGPGGHVVHYFLRRGEIFNFVGIVERDDWRVESWTVPGTRAECAADFRGWHDDIQAIIASLDQPYKWALLGREPLPGWTRGRVTLLGDACHPMLPMLAQGANMALEDALVLARALGAQRADIAAALLCYERARLARTARAVRGSAENAGRFHSATLSQPDKAAAYVSAEWDPEKIKARYDWLFEYDATRVPLS